MVYTYPQIFRLLLLSLSLKIGNIVNYREYLASKGLLYVDEQERLRGSDPLGREYYVFKLSTLARSFKELTSRIKDYAHKTYDRDIIIVANQWGRKRTS